MKHLCVSLVLWVPLFLVAGCGGEEKGVPKAAMNHFVAASKAISAGDNEAALLELSASIEEKPSAWAYYQRARVMLETGKEEESAQDCVRGLELDPAHRDLKWFAGELKKPAKKRFKGRFKEPPSARK